MATAISVYATGIYIGMGLSYMLGGIVVGWAETQPPWNLPIVGTTQPWQLIFFVIGLPGVALVPLLFTIREPRVHPTQRRFPIRMFWKASVSPD